MVDKPLKPRKYCKRVKVSSSENETSDEKSVPYSEETMMLNVEKLIDTFKNQYMTMLQTMQTPTFLQDIENQLTKEKVRKDQLSKRVGQLQTQIDNLVQESLEMLKFSLTELGIEALNPTEFIVKAKDIVCNHNELQNKKIKLENEVVKLQDEHELLLKMKEKELFECLINDKSSLNISDTEILNIVRQEISHCVYFDSRFTSDRKGMDVTLTRVNESLASGSQNGILDDNNNGNDKFSLSKIDNIDEQLARELNAITSTNNPESELDADFNVELPINLKFKQVNKGPADVLTNLSSKHIDPHNFNSAVLSHINNEIEKGMRTVEMFTVPTSSLASSMFNDQTTWSVNMNSGLLPVTSNSKYSDSFKHLNSVSRISQVKGDLNLILVKAICYVNVENFTQLISILLSRGSSCYLPFV